MSTASKPKTRKAKVRRCRICRCTDERACPEGCSWVEGVEDLCSACAKIEIAIQVPRRSVGVGQMFLPVPVRVADRKPTIWADVLMTMIYFEQPGCPVVALKVADLVEAVLDLQKQIPLPKKRRAK
jgi:hypothetical protein